MTGVLSEAPPEDADIFRRASELAAHDPRPDSLDLAGESYRDATGAWPLSEVVADAERQILRARPGGRPAPTGDPAYHAALIRLVLGEEADLDRLAMASTVGGTGALRLGLELVCGINPGASVWLPDPGWPQHVPLVEAAGLAVRRFRYAGPEETEVHGDRMLSDLRHATRGDVILLQGCCHAPTGLDLTPELWGSLAGLCQDTGALPLIDLAHLGFGAGLSADADGLHSLMIALPEALLAVSCAETFGLPGERPGLLAVQSGDARAASRLHERLTRLCLSLTGAAPEQGARLVTEILDSAPLRERWNSELREKRLRLASHRIAIAAALRAATGEDRWDMLATGRGPYAVLPLEPGALDVLRRGFGTHLAPDGRVNLSALPEAEITRFAEAVAAVLRGETGAAADADSGPESIAPPE